MTVDGDYDPQHDNDQTYLARHPEFAQDYDAFIAPHYDADIYAGAGGWFWDRATTSTTGAEDDRLGRIFESHYASLPSAPAPHFERRNANTHGYYGFRCTTNATPGILVEHGVGWGADRDWLRANVDAIANLWDSVLAEFMGVDMTQDEFNAMFLVAYAKYKVPEEFERIKREDEAQDVQIAAIAKPHRHAGPVLDIPPVTVGPSGPNQPI